MYLRQFHSRLASWSIFGLVAASLVAVAPAAQANGSSGPVNASGYSFSRFSTDGHSLLIQSGENASVTSEGYLSDGYTGWPTVVNKSIFTRSAFKLVNPPADLNINDPYRYWQGSYSQDQNYECVLEEYDTATLTITSQTECVDSLWVNDSSWVSNETEADLTVDTNALSQVLKVGKKGKPAKTITESNGLTNSLFASVYVYNQETVTLGDDDDYLSADFQVCIDESLVSDGDELAFDFQFTRGAVPMSTEDFWFGYSDSDYGVWDTEDTSAVTFAVDVAPEQNLTFDFSLGMKEDLTSAGTYEGTVDVLNATNGDVSVTEPCFQSEDTRWPTMAVESGAAGSPEVGAPSYNWNATDMTPSDDFDRYSSTPDGFGNLFYWEAPLEGGDDAAIVLLDPAGPRGSFNVTGTRLVETSDDWGYFDIASYGAGGTSYFTLAMSNSKTWILTTGTKTGAASGPVTVTNKNLTKLCPSKFSATWMSSISAPTDAPMAQLYCSSKTANRSAIIKFDAGVPKLVTQLGASTASKPCVVPYIGIDGRATGTENAVVIYTRTSSSTPSPYGGWYCPATGSTVSNRTVTTITATGVAATTPVASDPWGQAGEPDSFEIVAGNVEGTWIGLTGYAEYPEEPTVPANLVEINALSAIERGPVVDLSESSVDLGDYWGISPVKQLSDTEWIVKAQGLGEFDSEPFYKATVGTVDTETGLVTWGDVVVMSDYGSYWPSSRFAATLSSSSNNLPTFYAVTGYDSPNYDYTAYQWTYSP